MDQQNPVDPLLLLWIALWTAIGSYGLCLQMTESKLASSFYVYGKSLKSINREGFFWRLYLLPKRYFRHFYLSATLIFLSSLAIVVFYYIPSERREKFIEHLDTLTKRTDRHIKFETTNSIHSITSLVFTLILMIIQTARRLYESFFVSVYSRKSQINIIHYIFGHVFYLAAALSTICPILLSRTCLQYTLTTILDNLVTKKRAILFVLFIYASHYQHKCHKILGNLRKDKTGKVISEEHYVPTGGLFEYVSCPHFLTEVVVYLLIVAVQDFSNSYWNLIFLLVASTQTINALTEHKWYKKKYTDYPKHKKAIFPALL